MHAAATARRAAGPVAAAAAEIAMAMGRQLVDRVAVAEPREKRTRDRETAEFQTTLLFVGEAHAPLEVFQVDLV